LTEFDLPSRLAHRAPRLVVETGVALGVVGVATLLRWLLDQATPGIVPFALAFPAVFVATLLAGARSGFIALIVAGLSAWYLVMEPRLSFAIRDTAQGVSLAIYALSAGVIVLIADLYRASALRFAAESRAGLQERDDLLSALRESDDRLALATSAGRVGVWDWRLDEDRIVVSPEAREIFGFDADAPLTLDAVRERTHPDDREWTRAQSDRARDPAVRDAAPYEYRIVTPAGEERWVLAHGRAVFAERDGRPVATRYVGTLQDITARKRAEAALAASEAGLRLALGAGRMAVWQAEAPNTLAHSAELNHILGFPPDAQPTLAEVNARYGPGELDRVRAAGRAALARGDRFVEAEFKYVRPDGEARWLLMRAEIRLGPDGAARTALGVVVDVTERRQAEERLKLLAREVDHRANNLLAVVQGTVRLSQAPDVAALKAVIVGRINALARAHQLLADARWDGADLRRLVEEELLAFSLGEAARVRIAGERVALPPAAAQAIAMALHELATNAAKYGALSTPGGRVEVAWTRVDGQLRLIWQESGGPPVTPPSRRGLGATMLQRALEGPLKGHTRLDWRPEGLVCELEMPLVAERLPTPELSPS
jgi:PAS domain S-box-containing protein